MGNKTPPLRPYVPLINSCSCSLFPGRHSIIRCDCQQNDVAHVLPQDVDAKVRAHIRQSEQPHSET